MLNIHPSLLPKYKGLHTHQRAIDAGDVEAGCSVHEVTAELDGGQVLGQARVPILPEDTAETLAARVLVREHALYPTILRRVASGDRTRLDLD
jgi:phosphoribosylglycinamide formyltransferase-1